MTAIKIWVDADACPKVIKDILFRVAERRGVQVTLVANQYIRVPESPHIGTVQVADGPDIADDEIVALCAAGDLVITADIPLAARVIDKGAHALDPRGRMYTADNIRQTLNMRDFYDSLRGSGIDTGGPDGFGQREREEFANHLDRLLARHT